MNLKAKLVCTACGANTTHLLDENSNLDLFNQIKGEVKTFEFKNSVKKEVELETSRLKLQNLKKESDLKTKYDEDLNKKSEELTDKSNRILTLENEVNFLRNYQTSSGTKNLGEGLEHHINCLYKESLAELLPDAQFGKDNDSSKGSKGDHIFREMKSSEELVSIMFDMKNEFLLKKTDSNKNEGHYEKLDKDRNQKNCEWAVLVSLLERDNKMFNSGMYFVPEKDFRKMIVIRPENFVSTILTLRRLGEEKIKLRKDLSEALSKNTDANKLIKKLKTIESGSSEYFLEIHSAIKSILEEIDGVIRDANRIIKRSKKQRNICINDLIGNVDSLYSFIEDNCSESEDNIEFINSLEIEAASA